MKSCIGKRSGTVIRRSDEGSDPGRDQLEHKIPIPERFFVRDIQLRVDQQVLERLSMCSLRGSLGLSENPLESGHTYIEESHEVVAFQFLSKVRLTNPLLTNVVSAKARNVKRGGSSPSLRTRRQYQIQVCAQSHPNIGITDHDGGNIFPFFAGLGAVAKIQRLMGLGVLQDKN